MNKKTILLSIFTFLGTLLVSSCGTSSRFRIKSSDHQEINKGSIQQVNKLADYRVDIKKVTGTHENQTGYNISTGRVNIETAKEFAIADAIQKAKCDFLINPLYDIEVAGTYIKVTVEGYPAYYTKFETIETMMVDPSLAPKSNNFLLDMYTNPKK